MCPRKDEFELLLMFAAKGAGSAYSAPGSYLVDNNEASEAAKLAGDVIPQDAARAEKLLLEVIEKTGNPDACCTLGNGYYHGTRLPEDKEKGWRYLLQACQPKLPDYLQGSETAKVLVPCILNAGEGRTEEENRTMFRYFTEASENENLVAQKMLLNIYLNDVCKGTQWKTAESSLSASVAHSQATG